MADEPPDEQLTSAGRRPLVRDVTEPSASLIEVEVGTPVPAAPPRVAAEAHPVLEGRYRVLGLLGRGGMGEVFRAEHIELCTPVAVKVFNALPGEAGTEMRKRFAIERRALALVDSNHVVKINDMGVMPDGREFFVMPFIPGQDLQTVLKKNKGPLPVRRAVNIVEQALKAVAAAHRVGVVHRDLKPSNLMLRIEEGDDHVYVVDFGIAKLRDATGEHTQQGFTVGTPGYMAPEALTKTVVPDQAPLLDIYAMGIVLFELVAGRRPYAAPSPSEEIREALGDAPEDLRPPRTDVAIAPWLKTVIDRAIARRPEDRFPSAEAFRQALKNGGEVVIERLPAGTIIDDRDNHLRIDKNLGRGGTGTVYSATDMKLGSPCAVKFLTVRPGTSSWDLVVERFYRDRVANLVAHPNVVRVYDRGEWCGRKYLVLEFLEGQTLRAVWSSLSWPQILDVLKQLAAALDATHAIGVVHRDVTPENVMVSKAGEELRVKLFDFGLARTPKSTLTRKSSVEPIGRYGYLPPEQLLDPDSVGGESDQWSVAAMTYEWLCGRQPHREAGDDDEPSVYSDRLISVAAPPSPLPGDQPVNAVLLRALAMDRAQRFPSVLALVEALAAAPAPVGAAVVGVPTPPGAMSTPGSLAAGAVSSPSGTTAPVAQRRGALRSWRGAAAALVVLAAGSGALAWRPWAAAATSERAVVAADAAPVAPASPPAAAMEPPPAEPDGGPVTAAVTTKLVTRTVSSPVAGAKARIDGKDENLPATITREQGTTMTVVVSRHGYRDKTVEVVFDQEGDLAVPLERRSTPSASAKTPPPVVPDQPPKRREARQLYMDLDSKEPAKPPNK